MRFTPLIGPVGEMRAISTAAGGTALTSASTFLQLLPGSEAVQVVARNYATAVAVQVALSPWLTILKTTDDFATTANATDYSDAAQDGSTGTDVTLSSLASTHALWVGSPVPIRGISIDVDATNGNAATMAAVYWTTGATMASLTITDGTANGGATLAQDGTITWTVPTDWQAAPLSTAAAIPSRVGIPYAGSSLYWIKFTVNAALDSSVSQNSWIAMSRSTAYHELIAEAPELAMAVRRGGGGHAALELKTDAGTANVVVNVMTSGRFV